MKLKLSHKELKAMLTVVASIVTANYEPPLTPLSDEGLSYLVLLGLYQKLWKKDNPFMQKKINITLAPAEQVAFWIWLCDYPLQPDFFTGNLIQTICNNIHQQYQIPQL